MTLSLKWRTIIVCTAISSIVMLETNRIESVMVIAPHGDDEVLGAGGLLAKCQQRGLPVKVLFLAVDASHHFGLDTPTTLEQRIAEIEAASRFLGYEYEIAFAGRQLLERLDTLPLREMVDLIEGRLNAWKPDLLLLPHGDDYDQDHVACFRAAHAATRPIPENCGKHLAKKVLTYEMPKLEWATTPFRPCVYWEISDVIAIKKHAIELYGTQLRNPPHIRSLDNIEALARLRGSEVGVSYAEAFHVLRWVA